MKKIFLSFLALSASLVIYAQIDFTPTERSKYHMISSEELHLNSTSRAFSTTPPPTGGTRNIAEFEPNQGVIISYPNGFRIPYTLITQLAAYVKVYIICPSSSQSTVTSSLISNGANMNNVFFVSAAIDSEWARDYSPWFIEYGENNQVGIVDFPYNRPQRQNDDEVPIVLGDYFNMEVFGMNLEHTGGNYMTDGLGISASCDLVYDENPGLNEAQIDQLVEDYMGITAYHCVPDPLGAYIEHIDCWGKFLDVDKMLVAKVPLSNDRYADFEAMADYWANQTSSYGNNYQVFRTNWMVEGNAYTNSLIMNDKVFVAFNNGNAGNYNAAAAAAYEDAMPGYEIIGISYNNWYSTDALHCRTHEVPDFEMLRIVHMPYFGVQEFASSYNFDAEVYSFNNSNNITSVKLFYSENDDAYNEIEMTNTGGNIYAVSIEGLSSGAEIRYYIQANDERPKTETHPFIGNADPHMFTIEDVSGICKTNKTGYIKAFPNPATEVLYFINNNIPIDNYSVKIYNEMGSIVKTITIDNADENWNLNGINISDLKSGLYYISAFSKKAEYKTKFIKL